MTRDADEYDSILRAVAATPAKLPSELGPGGRFSPDGREPPAFRGTNRFRILRRLGAGGMGIVYEALDCERNTRVALKTLRTLGPDSLLRFKNEFHSLQDLHHRNLVGLLELICERDQWFFTMELVEGVDFLSYIRGGTESAIASTDTRGAADARLRVSLGQLARGLIALHDAGKVHRDIKPSNIVVAPDGRVVLLDFGLVTTADGARADSSEVARVGTSAYMAPEQAASKPVGPEADWYSVGVMLYECLTGGLPFSGSSLQILIDKQRREPPPPRDVVGGISTDLDSLCADLLRFDPSHRPDGRTVVKRLGLRELASHSGMPVVTTSLADAPTFVGRSEQFEALRAAYEQASRGTSVTVVVRGESGIGKSALVRRFAEDALREGAVVLRGRCYERESVPYKAFDGIIDALSRYLGRLPKHEVAALLPMRAALLAQVFPVLRRVEAILQVRRPFQDATDPQELRNSVFVALRDFLTRVAEARPLILVIDDLQWADADSLALLDHVMKPPDAPPLLLIATVRPVPTAEARGFEDRLSGPIRRIEMGPLPQTDARSLAIQLGRAAGLSDEVACAIAEEAQGHPLFIDELVRHHMRPANAGRGAMRLEDVLWARITKLESSARRLLEIVVLAGTPLPQDVAARAADTQYTDFTRSAAVLRVANLIRTTGVRGTDAIEPFHDRVRVAVLAHLDPQHARDCHERLALALEAYASADPEALAVHWRAAGDPARAIGYATAAAEQAVAAFAFDRAARLYQLSVELATGSSDGGEARALRIALAESLANAGRSFEAASVYRLAADGADPEQSVDLKRLAADNLLRSGRIDQAMSTLREVVVEIGVNVPRTRRQALASLLWQRMRVGLRGLRFTPRHPSEVPRHELARIKTLYAASTTLGMVDHLRGADVQTRHLRAALDFGDERSVWRALAIESVYRATRGRKQRAKAEALAREVELNARRLGDPSLLATSQLAVGACCFFTGRYAATAVAFEAAERMFGTECHGFEWEQVTARYFATYSRLSMGQFEEAGRKAERYVADAERRNDIYARSLFKTHPNVWRLLCKDQPEEALRELSTALEGWPDDAFYMAHFLEMIATGTALNYQRRYSESFNYLRERSAAFKQSILAAIPFVMAEYRRYFMHAALAVGELSEVRRMIRGLARMKTPLAGAYVMLFQGALAHRRGDLRRGQQLLLHAAQAFESVDTPHLAMACKAQLGRLIGGAEGPRLIDDACAWMRGQGVENAEQMIDLLAPRY